MTEAVINPRPTRRERPRRHGGPCLASTDRPIGRPSVRPPQLPDLEGANPSATEMEDFFVPKNPARTIRKNDHSRNSITSAFQLLQADPRGSPVSQEGEAGARYILVNRYLERIADHAVNIGTRVVYMVTEDWMPRVRAADRARRRTARAG